MEPTVETHLLEDDGEVPNHPSLPLVIVRHTAAVDHSDPAAWFEQHLTTYGWGACWRWVVYNYQHFHSNNHEVLGVSRGHATLLLGGEKGLISSVSAGDVIVLPAGTGHKSLEASPDFEVVGAYPDGREPDLIRPGASDLPAIRSRIAMVPLPKFDPIFGKVGGLNIHWGLRAPKTSGS